MNHSITEYNFNLKKKNIGNLSFDVSYIILYFGKETCCPVFEKAKTTICTSFEEQRG